MHKCARLHFGSILNNCHSGHYYYYFYYYYYVTFFGGTT